MGGAGRGGEGWWGCVVTSDGGGWAQQKVRIGNNLVRGVLGSGGVEEHVFEWFTRVWYARVLVAAWKGGRTKEGEILAGCALMI